MSKKCGRYAVSNLCGTSSDGISNFLKKFVQKGGTPKDRKYLVKQNSKLLFNFGTFRTHPPPPNFIYGSLDYTIKIANSYIQFESNPALQIGGTIDYDLETPEFYLKSPVDQLKATIEKVISFTMKI